VYLSSWLRHRRRHWLWPSVRGAGADRHQVQPLWLPAHAEVSGRPKVQETGREYPAARSRSKSIRTPTLYKDKGRAGSAAKLGAVQMLAPFELEISASSGVQEF